MASPSTVDGIPSPPEFTFEPSDVRLKITYKNALAYAHVSPGALAQASPVWKNFLFPPWPWSRHQADKDDILIKFTKMRSEPVKELDFTEDNAEALLVLLCIAHLRFEDILSDLQPPRELLVNLALLCDAYLCQDILRPWIGTWMVHRFKTRPDEINHELWWKPDNNADDYKAVVLLGWVFRSDSVHDHFRKGVEWFYKENCENNIVDFPADWPLPEGLMHMKALLPLSYEYLTYLEDNENNECAQHKQNCNAFLLKTYKDDLEKQKLYPRVSLEDMNSRCVNDLNGAVRSMWGFREEPYSKCNKALQSLFTKKIRSKLNSDWAALWAVVKPTARPKTPLENDNCRIETVTGWSKAVKEESEDEYDSY